MMRAGRGEEDLEEEGPDEEDPEEEDGDEEDETEVVAEKKYHRYRH